jgi:uncharacterized repeat protein (TIGR03803 family)
MPKKLCAIPTALLAFLTVALFVTGTRAVAQTETVLHNFANNGTDGYTTYSGLIFDASGNLYGTTLDGGVGTNCYGENIGCGTVFELSPAAGGGWTETILHDFNFNGTDGVNPSGTLIFDAAGNLYGTTQGGGTGACNSGFNSCGTVFELMPKAGGGWTETILHSFGSNSRDGYFPSAGLIFDGAGNLYGTTLTGGAYGFGTVFELTPKGGGWAEKLLHSFDGRDGASPLASLIFDAAGNLYGTTRLGGGNRQAGTVFELMPKAGGGWTGKVLHHFNAADGNEPFGSLVLDAAGNLYGTTEVGGANHHGTVFEVTPTAGGIWTETILHSFNNNGTDGYEPLGGLIFDAKGNLYGTTFIGGTGACARTGCGTVFELTPAAGGGWTETVLYSFPNYIDGYWPASGLIFDAAGNLYGTTVNGGTAGGCVCGMVFELTP